MCYRTECGQCGKPTWAGCGKHIEQALEGVPESERCHCREEVATKIIPQTGKPIAESHSLPRQNGGIGAAEQSITSRDQPTTSNSDLITHKHTLSGHTDRVWNVAIHPTIPLIATASADKTVRLFSAKSFEHVGLIEGNHKRSIRSCAWKPGEPKPVLATASFDGTAGIWDSQTDEDTQETEWECAGLLEGHENEVKSVAWSASGTLLATCSRDKSIWIWECENYEDPECVSVMQEHSQDVKCVVWHPTEELLASGSYDDEIRIWRDDGDDWICCAILKGHEGTVWSIDFATSGEDRQARLVSASGDSTVRVWTRTADPASATRDKDAVPSIIRADQNQVWEETAILPASHLGDIYTVAWSKHSNRIASAGEDGNITIYSSQLASDTGRETWAIVAQKISAHGVHEINHLAWGAVADDGSELLFSAGDDGVTNVWSVSSSCTSK